MKIRWYGHAAFLITMDDGYSLFLDPFKDDCVPGLKNIKASAHRVCCSHEHGDHNGKECITLLPEMKSATKVSFIKVFHDHHKGEHRGENLITIIEGNNKKLVHLGDLGHLLEPAVLSEIKDCDYLLMPVGGYYTINALEASVIAKTVSPKHIIPMHYSSDTFGYPVISPVEEFLSYFAKEDIACLNTSETAGETDSKIIVLKY